MSSDTLVAECTYLLRNRFPNLRPESTMTATTPAGRCAQRPAERTEDSILFSEQITDLAQATALAASLLGTDEHLVQSGESTALVMRGRNAMIIGRVVDGESYAAVARDFDVSGERVRQLSAAYLTPAVMPARKQRMAARRAAVKQGGIREFAATNPGMTVAEIAKATNVSMDKAFEALGPEVAGRSLRNTRAPEYSDEDCFTALRRAAGPDGTTAVSMGAYARANEGFSVPADYTLVVRFGSWADACAAAGVTPGARPKRDYATAWSDDELRSWLARFFDEVGLDPLPSMPQYKAWAAIQPGNPPSAITVRNRLGRWSTLISEYATSR